MRLTIARATAVTASAIMIAALTVGVGGASASPTTHRAFAGSLCAGVLPGCGTLLVDSPSGALALQANDPWAGAQVLVQQRNSGQSGQDWTPQSLGTVSRIPLSEQNALGITAYDLRAYGADHASRLELTPDGRLTGLCAEGVAGKLVLAPCLGVRQQRPSADVFIGVPTGGGNPLAGQALLLLQQAHVPGDHLAMRGSDRAGVQVTLARRAPVGVEVWYEYTVPPATPVVTGVSPQVFDDAGGMAITITGTEFTGVIRVNFGTVPATSFVVNSNSSITAIAPAELPGAVPLFSDVTVVRYGQTSARSPADDFVQEDAQIDENCVGTSGHLILYSVPDPLGGTTTAAVTDTSLPAHASPTFMMTDEPATDGTPGWLESTVQMVVPFGDTDTYSISADSGSKHWTGVQIAIGGPDNCGLTVWRG